MFVNPKLKIMTLNKHSAKKRRNLIEFFKMAQIALAMCISHANF